MRELEPLAEAAQEEAGRATARLAMTAAAPVLQLQRQAGNRAVTQLVLARRPSGVAQAAGRIAEHFAAPPGSGEFAKLIGSDATQKGQFVFTATISKRIDDRLAGYLRDMPEDQSKWVKGWLDSYQEARFRRKAAEATKVLQTIKTYMDDLGTPPAQGVSKLMGNPTETGIGPGAAAYTKLWNEYAKPGADLPDMSAYENYASLAGIHAYENIACKATTERLGAKASAGRGGKGRRNASTSIPKDTSIAADVKRDVGFENGMVRGDVVVYASSLESHVTKMRKALDDGWTIHARCISGTTGVEGGRSPDHSILIYGYAGDVFHFFDSDVGGTGGLTPGWGRIYYDRSVPRLSTARTDADFRVYEFKSKAEQEAGAAVGHVAGFQASGLHRYQVKDIWTM